MASSGSRPPPLTDFWLDGVRLGLTDQSRRLLVLLYSRAGETVSRDELMTALWPDPELQEEQNLDQAIARLRAAFSSRGHLIVTVRKSGYRLDPDSVTHIGPSHGQAPRGQYAGRQLNDAPMAIWNLGDARELHLVCPELPANLRAPYWDPKARDYLRLAKFADIDSLFHLRSTLLRSWPTLDIYDWTSEELPAEFLTKHLVLIGGPAWNSVARHLMPRTGLPWEFRDGGAGKDDPIVDVAASHIFLPTYDSDGAIESDIGLFARLPNPFNDRSTLFLVSGVQTFGVLSAARCFTAGRQAEINAALVLTACGEGPFFATLFRAPMGGRTSLTPALNGGDLISLIAYSQSSHAFREVT